MEKIRKNVIYRNLANIVSILGVIPLLLLFQEGGYQYLIPLMIYNNIMDDLDGILAAKLDIKSHFGAILDNVCDAVAHTIFVMVVGVHFGVVGIAVSLMAATAIILRVVTRIDPNWAKGTGTATNEMVRHILFILLLAQIAEFNPAPFIIAVFMLHTVSMLVPYKMPHLIRSLSKSTFTIALVNVALIVAWLVPATTLVIAGCFFMTYFYSFIVGGINWRKPA